MKPTHVSSIRRGRRGNLAQQELRSFAAANPAVASGLLAFEVRPWLVGMRA